MSGVGRGTSFGPNLKKEDIVRGELMAKGEYGTVWKGKCRSIDVAIKFPLKQKWDKRNIMAFRKEVQIMSEIFHPNVCLFMGACLESGHISIVSELMSGSLTKLLKSGREFPLSTRMDWARQAAEGMSWLHANNPPVIHLDLKPDNLLYDEELNIKVCDFGLSRFMEDGQDRLTQPIGTPLYMSPEVMEIKRRVPTEVTAKVDVYSYGIILWEILTRKDAFAHHKNYAIFSRAVREGERPPIPPDCPADISALMEKCWTREATERPSFREIAEELEAIIARLKRKEEEDAIALKVDDSHARAFWVEHFLGRTSVPWKEFAHTFLAHLHALHSTDCGSAVCCKETDVAAQCLKAVLAEDNEVTLDQFGQTLGYFGPLVTKGTSRGFMEKIAGVLSWTAFHGFISSTIATQLLKNEPKGVYLLRFSKNTPNSFCLSKSVGSKGVQHLVLPYDANAGCFPLKSEEYGELRQLVEARSKEFGLIYSYPCERFLYLFDSNVAPSAGYDQIGMEEEEK